MSVGKPDLTVIPRRAVSGPSAPASLGCPPEDQAECGPETLVGRCADWLAMEFESDRLSRRWAALEADAVSNYNYFRLTGPERRGLPMAAEMAAIEAKLEILWKAQKRQFRAIAKLTPANVHEMACLMVVTAKIDGRDEGPAGPLIRKAMTFLASATCPGCGAPYVPSSLPQS